MAFAEETIRVLLVEDDGMSRDLWSLLLEGEGYQVRAVDSGETALQALQQTWSPSVVLMDMQLPGLAGAPLAAAIREACQQRHRTNGHTEAEIIVLAMSGSEPRGAQALAGFDGFLLKPFTIDALESRITAALHAAPTPAPPLTSPLPQAATPAVEALVLDAAVYDRLAASMPPSTLADLYGLCLRDARVRLDSMHRAALDNDEAAYQRQAHAIKGGCGLVGALALATLAGQMESEGLAGGIDQVMAQTHAVALACEQLEGMLRERKILVPLADTGRL